MSEYAIKTLPDPDGTKSLTYREGRLECWDCFLRCVIGFWVNGIGNEVRPAIVYIEENKYKCDHKITDHDIWIAYRLSKLHVP